MELVNVNLFAEGYYSGSTYEDNIWIKKSSYEKLANVFPEEISCGELDGKHDEVIKIQLDKIPSNYETLAVTVTIYDAESRFQNFGMVGNAYVRVVDEETGEELIRFDLSEDFSTETALVVAEIYKHNSEWKFKAVGSGYNGGLKALCNQYGIDAE